MVIIFLLFSTNLLLNIIRIPTHFLGLSILTLSFVGVYSLRNSSIDCAIAGFFGLLGFILKRLNLPIVPIILGMVLGGIMEVKLRTSMMRVDSPVDFINRPIAFILFLIIVLVVGTNLLDVIRSISKVHKRKCLSCGRPKIGCCRRSFRPGSLPQCLAAWFLVTIALAGYC